MTMLELGAGPDRQTPGYIHADINAFDGIDIVAPAWEIDLPNDSLSEVIAISVVEHWNYANSAKAFVNVRRMLKSGGQFIFDVPDLAQWCRYFISDNAPFDQAYCLKTLYGWQRFPGDEHISGWTEPLLYEYLEAAGFTDITISTLPTEFVDRGIYRYRFTRPHEDSHFYVTAA